MVINLKIAIVSPPLNKSGGVGTLYRYAYPNFPKDLKVNWIDSRGPWENPIFSILTVLLAILKLTYLRVIGSLDLVHINLGAKGSTFRKLIIAGYVKSVLRTPYVLQLHASGFDHFFAKLPNFLKNSILNFLNNSSGILVLGNVWKNFLSQAGVRSELLTILPMGVPDLLKIDNPDLYPSRKKASEEFKVGSVQSAFYILYSGEMSERKGLQILIEAIAQLHDPNIRLVVAGAGDVSHYRNLAKNLEIEKNVVFLGLVDPSVVHQILTYVDLFVLPSRAEGLPVSILEAFSAGVWTLATQAGATAEFAAEGMGITYLLSRDPEELAIKISTQLAQRNQNPGKTGVDAPGRHLWEEKFNVQETTRELIAYWAKHAKF